MRGRHLLYTVPMLLLSSCFIKPNAPGNQANPASVPSEGLIVLEDVSGDQALAGLVGEFDLQTSAHSFHLIHTASELPFVGFNPLLRTPQPRDPQCEMVQASHSPLDSAVPYVSGGAMSFGPALQSTLVSVPEETDNSYNLTLEPGLPPGVYQVQVAGSADIPAFATSIELPENLNNVTIENSTLDTHTITIKKAESLNVAWTAPSMTNDTNVMILDVYADSAQANLQLHCVIPETSASLIGGAELWTIDSSWLQQLPTTNTAQLYIARGNVYDATQDSLDVQLQGLRTHFANITLE